MRSVDSWLDRFAFNHPKFGIPHLMNLIIIGNVLVFILDMCSNGAATLLLGLSFHAIGAGEVWRLVTFIFVPDSFRPLWFVVSIFFYYFLGNTMEREWGTAKFSLFYLCGTLLTMIAGAVVQLGFGIPYVITLGSVHQTLFLAFATLFPEAPMRFYFIIPIKAKWLALLYFIMEIWSVLGVNRLFLPLILPLVLPTLIAAWINYLLFFWTPVKNLVNRAFGRAKHQSSKQTVNFKAAQKKAKETKGYLHKCAVCGKTDADDPNMEFRYCSKCDGYYCYCMDHINNHVHVKES